MTARVDLPASDVERYYGAMMELADEARQVCAPMLERGLAVETKKDASPVTEVGRAIERRLRELIARRFPDHGVIGEEYPPHQPGSAFQWILDPIDGTEELIHGVPTWGAMLALHHNRVPVVGLIDHPALDLRASAGVGLGTWCNGRRIRLREPSARAALSESPDLSRRVRAHRGRDRSRGCHGGRAQRDLGSGGGPGPGRRSGRQLRGGP